MTDCFDQIAPDVLDKVIHHPKTDTHEALWMAALRLVALTEKRGEAAPASRLLASWGYDKGHSRQSMYNWVHDLGIEKEQVAR
jgi:hypothetical protein